MVSWNTDELAWPTEAELDAELHAALDDGECGCVVDWQSCEVCREAAAEAYDDDLA